MKLGITRYKFRDGTFAYMADTHLPHKLVMETDNFTVEIPDEPSDAPKQNSEEKLCPCGHEHKPRSDGKGLRTYCVEGSQCNSDKCKKFVSLGADE